MKKVLLYQILAFTLHGKTQKSHITTINLTYQFQRGSYSISDVQDYFEYILKNMGKTLIIHQ